MNLLFRTDASLTMGTGHVMRCLALAQAWQDAGGCAMFAMAGSTPSIQSRLAIESCRVFSVSGAAGSAEDAVQTIALAREQRASWIAVDGYQFGADYQRSLKVAGFKVLFLDDYGHAGHYFADLVLNHNVQAEKNRYDAREPDTRLLLGPRYCLLRREFAAWRSWKREIAPAGRKILITMGGSDAENLTARVIEALALTGIGELEATVVVGGSNPHFAMLESSAAASGQNIAVRRDVSNMAELMASADVAISAAGSTCWELCLLGLPALLIDVAANQTGLAKELDARGCAIHLGDKAVGAATIAEQLTRFVSLHELRQSMSQRSRALVDGYGAARVISVLQGTDRVRLRRARPEDVRLLWEWANDPEVRAASFSSAPIPWETHQRWFTEKFGQGESLILIAENEQGNPFAQIRFDFRKDGEAELNISLTRAKRGCGLGIRVIESGLRELFASTGCFRVHAFVKPENAPSMRAFEQANFIRIGLEQVRGNAAVHFVYARN